MDIYSRGAQKCIMFDPFYKMYELEETEFRACIFSLRQGVAKSQDGRTFSTAGRQLIPINFCPFCAKKIEFIEE